MGLEFDPNKPAKTKNFFWATYFPDRRPNFKMHHQQNHATSAFQYRQQGILYKWDADVEKWVEIYRQEKSPVAEVCALCLKSTLKWYDAPKALNGPKWSFNSGTLVWLWKGREIPDRAWYCYECERGTRGKR